MAYKPYTLFKRPTRRANQFIYYVKFRDPETGAIMTPVSSGCRQKAAAHDWAIRQLQEGAVSARSKMTLRNFAANWFIRGKCPYLKKYGKKGKVLSNVYIDNCRSYLEKYIFPELGDMKLNTIRASQLEAFMEKLSRTRTRTGSYLSASSINNIFKPLRRILDEAYRLDIIDQNPGAKVSNFVARPKAKGVLTRQEVASLFAPGALETVWDNNLLVYCFNQIAATTGMRQGEILGLQLDAIGFDRIDVKTSWERKYGLKEPKWNSCRVIPVHQDLIDTINQLREVHLYDEPKALLFMGRDQFTAMDYTTVNKGFYEALRRIGIDKELRLERNITFHSWRHSFNTYMRNYLPDSKLQALTGHKSDKMTDHYTHFDVEDLEAVKELQRELMA